MGGVTAYSRVGCIPHPEPGGLVCLYGTNSNREGLSGPARPRRSAGVHTEHRFPQTLAVRLLSIEAHTVMGGEIVPGINVACAHPTGAWLPSVIIAAPIEEERFVRNVRKTLLRPPGAGRPLPGIEACP